MARIAAKLKEQIQSAALRLNRRLSAIDWFLNANRGALMRLRIPQPVSAALLLSLVAWVCIHGPILPHLRWDLKLLGLKHLPILRGFRGAGEWILSFTSLAGIGYALKIRRGRADPLIVHSSLLLTLLGVVYFMASADVAAAQHGLYRHVFMPIVASIAIAAIIFPRAMAAAFVNVYRRDYNPQKHGLQPLDSLLPKVPFLTERPAPEAGALQIFVSLLTPFYYPFRLLFPVAVAVLIAPYGEFAVYGRDFWQLMMLLLIVAAFFSALLFHDGSRTLAAAKHTAAAASAIMLPASLFFIFYRIAPFRVDFMTVYAALFGISAWLVLTVAGIDRRLNTSIKLTGRLFFSGGKMLLSLGIIVLAILRWVRIDYVTTILNSQTKAVIFGYISASYAVLWLYDYWIDRTLAERILPLLLPTHAEVKERGSVAVSLDGEPKRLEIFGGGRFVITAGGGQKFEAHAVESFFTRIVHGANPGVDPHLVERSYGPERLKRFVRFYTVLMNFIPFVIVGCTIFIAHRESDAELEAARPSSPPPMAYSGLRESLFAEIPTGEPRKVILLAASGGGTRAALFTASVLRGLWAGNALDNVVALSGVSGGSAAIAYFSIHREELIRGDAADAWRKYFNVMSAPFIDDVLEGTSELRTCSGTRTGIFLRDSFVKRMESDRAECIKTVGESRVGVIFNCTRAGQHEWQEGRLVNGTCDGAGAPIAFSNLDPAAFEHAGHDGAPLLCLRSTAIQDPAVPMTSAAALSANFPPVFANAAVDVSSAANGKQNRTRYWVTDGGASENRGTISLLYALRHALTQELAEQRAHPEKPARKLSPTHVVVADASAEDNSFIQDRGIGSAFAAADNYANQLNIELTAQINALCRQLHGDEIRFHYLGMPDILRVYGSVGTHWMLARSYALRHGGDHTVLRGETVKKLIAGLHPAGQGRDLRAPKRSSAESREQLRVRAWISADGYDEIWKNAIQEMRGN